MIGWLFLFISIISSVLVAHVLRWSKEKKSTISVVFLFNYTTAFLIAFIQANYSLFTLSEFIFGLCIGSIYIGSFYLFAESVKQNGLGVSVTSMRVSLAIPIMGSIFLYDEALSDFIIIGLVLVFISLYLITKGSLISSNKTKSEQQQKSIILALGLFVAAGIGDFSMKVYESSIKVHENPNAFLSIVFGTAAIIALSLVLKSSAQIKKHDAFIGVALGIPNVLSSLFMIFALQELSAIISYSVANIAVIVGSSGIGYTYWKDKLSLMQWSGIGLAVVALLILSSL